MSKQQIRVKKLPTDQVRFIKALRLIGQIGLKQASELANHLNRFRNSVVVAGIETSLAAHISQMLEDAGAEVVLERCSIETPMVCSPAVDAKYKWGSFRLIKKAI